MHRDVLVPQRTGSPRAAKNKNTGIFRIPARSTMTYVLLAWQWFPKPNAAQIN
jgi:hypothetical protein